MKSPMVGLVKHPLYLEHDPDDHPESPDRLEHIYAMLQSLDPENICYISPRMATHEEISLIHDMAYIERIARTRGRSVRLDPDTYATPRTYEAACLAVGGCLSLGDALISGQVTSGFALVRPPGHHAEMSRAMGFCIFNNVAIAARYFQQTKGFDRILIIDFDLHHGNGTQHSFYDDPSVLYVSTHQFPYYPGTGWYEEVGSGAGAGYTINIPMGYGMNDDDYLFAFQEILVPVAHLYQPDMILVSAGFDTYRNDPLGGMAVTESGYSAMTEIIMKIAQRCCSSRALFALEGGYDPPGLARCTKAVITMMTGKPQYTYEKKGNPCREIVTVARNLKTALNPYWGNF
ncbi:MAG: histone deacetylase [Syntrophorhabdus sp.]